MAESMASRDIVPYIDCSLVPSRLRLGPCKTRIRSMSVCSHTGNARTIPHDRVSKGGIVAVRLKPVKHVKNLMKLWSAARSSCHDRDDVIRCCEAKIPVVLRLQQAADLVRCAPPECRLWIRREQAVQ